jgi:hypothetical protein
MKRTCNQCNALAVWRYEPYDEREEKDRYKCNEHIKRGCSCNVDPNTGIEDTDDLGRLFPCCEYLFDDRGFDK